MWQLSAAEKAAVALQKAQATQLYAGLKLWPDATLARLAEAQLAEDGTYPGAAGVFAEAGAPATDSEGTAHDAFAASPVDPIRATADFDLNQRRDPQGRWTEGGGASAPQALPVKHQLPTTTQASPPPGSSGLLAWLGNLNPIGTASAQEVGPEEENRGLGEEPSDPAAELRIERYANATNALRTIDPHNRELLTLTPPNYVPSEADIQRVTAATQAATARSEREKADIVGPDQPSPSIGFVDLQTYGHSHRLFPTAPSRQVRLA